NCPGQQPLYRICGAVNELVDGAGPVVTHILGALVVVVAVIIAGRVTRGLVNGALERTSADRQVRNLIHNLLSVATLALAILAGLSALGLSFSVMVTSLGLTGLAVGLALQDLLRNVLAGIFLLVERPFRIGDVVTVGDLSGTVETIELRTTGIRTVDGRLAVMPNLNAFNGTVINSSAYPLRRYSVTVWVPQGCDLEAVLRGIRAQLDDSADIAPEPAPRVVPKLDIDGGVTLQVWYWLDYRSVDDNAVAADLVRRLYTVMTG
ncbi:MAG: mechanosensitive ion channel family protein, partial [Candidatus Dormibacteria bacterium]